MVGENYKMLRPIKEGQRRTGPYDVMGCPHFQSPLIRLTVGWRQSDNRLLGPVWFRCIKV
jgi:hypothetical protein